MKDIKQDTAKASYAKRRSPRAERLSKKLSVVEKPEAKMPSNIEKSDKSISEEKEKVVSAKKKLDKSSSAKVKKSQAAAETKYSSVATTKFTGTNFTTNSTINSSNSALTATVSAVKDHPENATHKRTSTAFGTTVVTNYEPRKSLGPKTGSGEYDVVHKKAENLVAKARKAYQHTESKVRPKTSISCPKIGLEKESKQGLDKGEPAQPFSPGPPQEMY